MSCADILDKLTGEFDDWHCRRHRSCKEFELVRRDRAYGVRADFLGRYPFREQPSRIGSLTAKGLYNPGAGNRYFFKDIVWALRPLGGIGLRNASSLQEASDRIEEFRRLLQVVVDPRNTIAEKIDAPWDNIPGLGHGDRVVAKKIVSTYFPDRVMPIFRQEDMEHFVSYLGRIQDRDRLSQDRYGENYSRLSLGQQFELLSDVLIECKSHHETLRNEDIVYFMYCLYSGPSRPPGMSAWRGHSDGKSDPVAAVAELQTGIKSGQRFCESAEARQAIEKHAMNRATEHLEENGWKVRDVSRENRGYDLHCKRRGEALMVEVKGTTGDGTKVLLTPNEVLHARTRRPKVGLIVVFRILLSPQLGTRDGEIRELKAWDVDRGILTPVGYEYTLPQKRDNPH